MERLEIGEAGDQEWDAFLRTHPEGHHEQSGAYGRERKSWGFACDRVAVREGGRLVGGAMALPRPSPVGVFAIVRWGPLAVEGRPDVLARAAEGLDVLARRKGYASLRVDTFPNQPEVRAALERLGFHASEPWSRRFDSLAVPLAGNDDALLARMSSKGRYNVRLARRSGVTAAAEGVDGLGAFYDLHLQTAAYQEFPVFPRAYFDDAWRVFGPSGRMQVLVARHGGRPIAAIIVCVVGDRCYYGWGGMSREAEDRKRMPNYLLHFTAMGWARGRGCARYDLVGRSDFKDKLGGEPLRWPSPSRKFYGLWSGPRRWAFGWTWRRALPRRAVEYVTRRLYAPMPF